VFKVEPGNQLVIRNRMQVGRLQQAIAQLPHLSNQATNPAALHQYFMDGVLLQKLLEAISSTTTKVTLTHNDMFDVVAPPVGEMLGIYPSDRQFHTQLLTELFAESWQRATKLL